MSRAFLAQDAFVGFYNPTVIIAAMNFQELVSQRHSSRTFNGLHIDKTSIARIQEEITRLTPLFDDVAVPEIRLVDNDEAEGKLGTYGFITGARQFLVMAAGSTAAEQVQAGFMFEELILRVTAMGLGTCWLGVTFRRGPFAEAFGDIDDGKEVSIVSPVGHSTPKRRFAERMMRRMVKSDTRKPFDALFEATVENPSAEQGETSGRPAAQDNGSCGLDSNTPLHRVLEAVRLAPSSSNSQPWRAKIKFSPRQDGSCSTVVSFHCVSDNRFSPIDMGIAYCHFLLSSRQENIKWKMVRTSNPVELQFRSC